MSYDYSERFSNWQVGGAAVQEVAPVVEESPVAPDEEGFHFDDEFSFDDENECIDKEYVINHCQDAYYNRMSPRGMVDYMTSMYWDIKAVFRILDDAYWSGVVGDEGFRYWVIAMQEMVDCGYSPNAPEPEVFFGGISSDRFGFHSCSDAAQMKTLYRKLARQYHPDLGGSESDMQELNAAYESAIAYL